MSTNYGFAENDALLSSSSYATITRQDVAFLRSHARYQSVVSSLTLVLNLIFYLLLVGLVASQYSRLAPLVAQVETTLPVVENILSEITTYAPVVESILGNVTNINYLIEEATLAVPYLGQVWTQYQHCSPLLKAVCV